MDIFGKITSNPAFASNIEELVYDARLYWGHMTEYGMYARAYERGYVFDYPRLRLLQVYTTSPYRGTRPRFGIPRLT